MTKIGFCGGAFGAALAIAFFVGPAHATGPVPTRVFVGAQGSDGNPCTFALPCRTFQHAHDTVAANGEIDVLDPAGYGALIISKALSIQGHGFSGITAPSGTAILITAGANDSINLRGLLIDGAGAGQFGVQFASGASLAIQDTLIRGFGKGISFVGASIVSNSSFALSVTNTVVSDNAQYGIFINADTLSNVHALIDHVTVLNNKVSGILVLGGTQAGTMITTVSNSVFANNTGTGIDCNTVQATPVNCLVRNSATVTNGLGLNAGGASALSITRSTIAGNVTSWAGNVHSYGDNEIEFNADTNASPPSTAHK